MKPTDGPDGYKPRRKTTGLATPIAKAYVERERRMREEAPRSPLLSRPATTGRGCLHLREDENDNGTLLVNGSIVVHVNPTALFYLKLLFSGEPDNRIIKRITSKFKVSSDIAKADLAGLRADLERLERSEAPKRGSRVEPLSGPALAPYRMDLAITYRTSVTPKAPNAPAVKELEVEEWTKVLDNLWNFGVPHVCITGGEPTVREDLTEIVEHASSLGMMVGLLTDGERLGSSAYVGRLLDAGVAYVQVSLTSHDDSVHAKLTGSGHLRKTLNGIRHCLKESLPVLANILITKESEYTLEDTVDFLIRQGVSDITVNSFETGSESSLPDWLMAKAYERARRAARGRARVFCFGPTPGTAPPMAAPGDAGPIGDLAIGNLEWGAGLVSLHVHPDGSVTAGRGHAAVLGNVLTHGWNMIWFHSLLNDIRAKQSEGRRWRALQELGFNGYPLFPGLKVMKEDEGTSEDI